MSAKDEIINIFLNVKDKEELEQLFDELLTPRELSDLYMRWQLMKELHEGNTQRSIAAKHRISLCKITRGSKILKGGGSMVKKILDEERYQAKIAEKGAETDD